MALPNGDLITTVFDPQMAYPVDKRMQVDTLNSRDSISMFIRWEGMEVYVLENSKKYILQGGRSNEYWKETGTGTGTGGTTFVGQFPTADLLPTSGRSAGDYAFVGTGDDFVQYNWDNIANEWVMAEGQTDMASEFFHIGYKTPLRRPVIFPLFPKDVLVQESGDFVFSPETAVARFIFTGEVTAIRGIETVAADREIKLVNRTGSDIILRDKASGIPSDSGFDFGGTDYTWVNGSEITIKGNGTYWELAPNNQIAFSDHLDSVNAQVSVGSDGLDVISGVFDKNSKKYITLVECTIFWDGSPMDTNKVDGIVYFFYKGKYWSRTDQVSVKDFGAKGDGTTDDTLAIQKAVDSKGVNYVYFPIGIYLISSTINSQNKNITFIGSKITIKANAPMINMINNQGDYFSVTGIRLDGNNIAQRGIRSDAMSNVIEKNVIKNLLGTTTSAIGVHIVNALAKNTSIKDNVIQDIYGTPNSEIADSPGASRGISVQSNSVFDGTSFIISGNQIENITGEEGDGIHINLSSASTYPYVDADALVTSNLIRNCSRRAVKIQASSVVVTSNIYSTSLTDVEEGDNAKSCIDIIASRKVLVSSNTLDSRFNEYGIGVTTPSDSRLDSCLVSSNIIESDENRSGGPNPWPNSLQGGILLNRCDGASILGNQINKGWRGINILDSQKCNISSNILKGGTSGSMGIVLDENSHENIISENIGYSDAFRTYFIDVSGDKNHIKGNRTFFSPSGSYRVVRTNSGSSFNYVFENSGSADSVQNIQDDGDNTYLFNNPVTGEGGNISPMIFRGVGSPTTGFHHRGEIIIDPYASDRSPLGYYCTSPGTPGTWSALPHIGMQFSGSDFPEGIVTAQPGSIYHRLSGGIYGLQFKQTGTGNTGWAAVKLNKSDKGSPNAGYTFQLVDRAHYFRFTGPSGNLNINQDIFTNGDELIGEIEGDAKTFVAGAGVTLRYPDGQGLTAPTGSRFIIKFKSATDALVSIIKPYTIYGIEVRSISDSGSIAPSLTPGFMGSRLNFTSSTAVTLQGFTSAGGQSSLTLVNPHATNNLTVAHNGAGTVKYIDSGATDLVIAPKTAVKLEIVGNEMYRVL